MEGFTLFVAVVFIVFGVLQIILFFKVWGMTNNVKRLAEKFTPTVGNTEWQMRKYILLDQREEAQRYLDGMYFNELRAAYNEANSYFDKQERFLSYIENLKKKYAPRYMQIGSELPPQFARISSFDDMTNIFLK